MTKKKKEPVRFPGDPDRSTLREARDWLYDNIKNLALCPACDQTAMMYQPQVDIRHCLGERFDYDGLMGAAP